MNAYNYIYIEIEVHASRNIHLNKFQHNNRMYLILTTSYNIIQLELLYNIILGLGFS